MKIRILIGTLALLLAACADSPDYEISLSEEEIRYKGTISMAGVDTLITLYQTQSAKPELLRIDSKGGEVRAGLKFGRWVRDNQLSVRVKSVCASSCANYVLTAGKIKYLDEQAVLAWHGGMKQANLLQQMQDSLSENYQPSAHQASVTHHAERYGEPQTCETTLPEGETLSEAEIQDIMLEQAAACVEGLAAEEDAFFKSIGVDPLLPYYGQIGNYQERYDSAEHFGFDYSLEDLMRMGVDNIELKDDAWAPELSKYYDKFKVYRVSL